VTSASSARPSLVRVLDQIGDWGAVDSILPDRETRREAVLGCWLLLRAANGPAFVRPSGPSLNEEKGGGELLGPR
jgi:hypothetical protein